MPRKHSSQNKIGVIGTVNRDTICRADGSVVKSWGGILYNLKYLDRIPGAEIVPAVNVGGDCFPDVMRIVESMRQVVTAHIHRVTQPNNHCRLQYLDQSDKREVLSGGVPPLTLDQVKPLLDCDLVLVNFISGRDIRLMVLERFRRKFAGLIYVDIHSLTLGRRKVTGGYRRFLRRPREWRRYCACADLVQINRTEFELLAQKPLTTEAAIEFYRRELPAVSCLIITLGAGGCLVVSGKGRVRETAVPPVKAGRVYDSTGCGDVFSAGFIAGYMATGDYVRAAAEGNRLAASRCRIKKEVF